MCMQYSHGQTVINYCDGPITIVSDVDKTFVLSLFTYTFLCIYLLNFCIRVLSSDTLNVKKSLRYLKKKEKKKIQMYGKIMW